MIDGLGKPAPFMNRVVTIAGMLAMLAGPTVAESSAFYIRGDVVSRWAPRRTNSIHHFSGRRQRLAGQQPDLGQNGSRRDVRCRRGLSLRAVPALRGLIGYIPSMALPNGTFNGSSSSATRSNISALVGLANGYLDFAGLFGPLPGNIQFFILGGAGFATVTNGPKATTATAHLQIIQWCDGDEPRLDCRRRLRRAAMVPPDARCHLSLYRSRPTFRRPMADFVLRRAGCADTG